MRLWLRVAARSNHHTPGLLSETPLQYGYRGIGDDSGDSRLHKFIRESRPPPGRTAETHESSSHARSASFSNTRPSAPESFVPTQSGSGHAEPTTCMSSGDWAVQLQRELYSETDPLGGLAHKDYYRDPATGYSPRYAPRNFSYGGVVAYPHAASSIHYVEATAQRGWLDHDVSRISTKAQEVRATSRQLSAKERDGYLQQHIPSDRFASHIPESKSLSVLAQLHNSSATGGGQHRRQIVLDRYQQARPSSEGPSYSTVGASLSGTELRDKILEQHSDTKDALLQEHLYIEHGLRDKERFDFTMLQRTTYHGFKGYDQDRFQAQQRGTAYLAQQLPPSVTPSSMEEAQKKLREASVPFLEANAQRAFARNTLTDRPKLGESLTEEIVDDLRVSRAMEKQKKATARKDRFGLGRQGALVQDSGPDKRTLKKHANDERLLHAMIFSSNAYRLTPTDEHSNPYIRGDTAHGVGHLLSNRFDIQRRDDRIGKREADLTERSIVHYGTPIQQTVDEFVFRRRNARGERPLEYFKPFPSFRDYRLSHTYQDTEGFSLIKQRPDFLEWEMFVRHRAHHQQRRELALLHGLEPVVNETAQERDARRLLLDKLCEQTPFDASRVAVRNDEMDIDVETLRSWFGVYLFPSPTVVESVVEGRGTVGLHIQHVSDELGTADTREHVMSCRYFNQLLLDEGYLYRVSRGFVREVAGTVKEVKLKYAQSHEVLRHFSTDELIMYEQYVQSENKKHREKWEAILQKRRYSTLKQQYATVHTEHNAVAVIDVRHEEKGTILTISMDECAKQLDAALGCPHGRNSSTEEGKKDKKGFVVIDGSRYEILPQSQRRVVPLTVELESGVLLETTDEEFEKYPLKVDASSEYNHALDYGINDYHYNRGNYIETQDVLWEKSTADGVEGWSPATHADGLRPDLPVRARRQIASSLSSDGLHLRLGNVKGDYQRGRIIEYLKQPFFNPEPRLVTVCFASDDVVEQVPLSDLMIWQRRYYGPERTVADESSRFNLSGLNRYVDVADPNNEKTRNGNCNDDAKGEHFLAKYETQPHAEANASRYRTVKQITEIDTWNRFDTQRPENFRPLSISHRRDYVRRGYIYRFTPWEWISVQEADQPILYETLRQDNTGVGHYFALNRHWRHKARPHGYLRNYENEIRDLFQYVDTVAPWRQAQKIRTYWEVRQHHPMPQFNRPEVAPHRNTAALLPTHLWETDKKTGKVTAVKDSVRDYQTKAPLPTWVQL